jgi:hypothetical protein
VPELFKVQKFPWYAVIPKPMMISVAAEGVMLNVIGVVPLYITLVVAPCKAPNPEYSAPSIPPIQLALPEVVANVTVFAPDDGATP